MKHLTKHPWEDVAAKYPEGAKVKGKVVPITDYGVFVELNQSDPETTVPPSTLSCASFPGSEGAVTKVGPKGPYFHEPACSLPYPGKEGF
jgi:ribosomal protein S1